MRVESPDHIPLICSPTKNKVLQEESHSILIYGVVRYDIEHSKYRLLECRRQVEADLALLSGPTCLHCHGIPLVGGLAINILARPLLALYTTHMLQTANMGMK